MRTGRSVEKVSILHEVDFELELIQRDDINVTYILTLLAKLKGTDNNKEYEYQYKALMQTLSGSPEFRSKQELIDKFIQENLTHIGAAEEVPEAFEAFWEVEKEKATQVLCAEEGLIPDHLKALVERMIYNNQTLLREDIFSVMNTKPTLLQREPIFVRLNERLKGFTKTFYDGI